MFYHFRQNNTGGSFTYDEQRGISCSVIVEAHSASEADSLAESIGLYFNGCESGDDCPCCGDRWYHQYENGTAEPEVYGEVVRPGDPFDPEIRFAIKWMGDDTPEGFIHYQDGRVEPFHQHKAEGND